MRKLNAHGAADARAKRALNRGFPRQGGRFRFPRNENEDGGGRPRLHRRAGESRQAQPWETTVSVTGASPEKPSACAPAGVKSMTRPLMKGPRSLMRTTTERPVARCVTFTMVPKGSDRCAAVRRDARRSRPTQCRTAGRARWRKVGPGARGSPPRESRHGADATHHQTPSDDDGDG